MVLYIVLTVLLLSLSFYELFCNPPAIRKRYLFYSISFILWIVSFLRWDVGTDWDAYLGIYEDCNYITWYEPGFIFLNRIVKNSVDEYTVLLAVLGGVLFLFQTKAIQSLSLFPLTTLFILLGTNLCNIFFVRQSVATAIILYSVIQIEQRNLWKFLLLIAVATSIHAASISFLPAYWIYHRRFTFKQIVLAFTISVVLGSAGGTFIWGGMGDMLGGIYAHKIDGYMEQGADATFNSGMDATTLYIRNIGGKLISLIVFLLLIGDRYKEKTRGMLNLFVFAIIMLPITISVSPSLGRMWTPYVQLQIFLMTYAVSSPRRLSNKMIFFTILVAMTLVRLYMKLFVDYDGEAFLPFETILKFI